MDSNLSFLRDLVAIDSVNPSLVPGAAGEWTIAHRIALEMHRVGLEDVRLTEVAPRRPNVVGVLAGAKPGRMLMLCGHMDTDGVTGMRAPFVPQERDSRLFGRGAQDMKGGVAAMVGAAAALTDAGGLPAGRLVVAAVGRLIALARIALHDTPQGRVGFERRRIDPDRLSRDQAAVGQPLVQSVRGLHGGGGQQQRHDPGW